jgi:hypothetical protein
VNQLNSLPRNKLLKMSLRLMQQLLTAIYCLGQCGHKITSLERHVKLEMGNILAKIFTAGRVGDVINVQSQSVLPL